MGVWKPDCQLTREIDKTQLLNSVNCLYERKLPINGKIGENWVNKVSPGKTNCAF